MNAVWAKSTLSFSNGNRVEVTELPGGAVGVRNSKDPGDLTGSALRCPAYRSGRGTRGDNPPLRHVRRLRHVPRYVPKRSNSPFRTPPRKACHSAGVNRRTGPAESLLLRTPIVPPGRPATSTQLPLA